MKRFFAIFGICLGAFIVFFAGYLGILYLNGEFDPVVILPENIAFEQNEYLLEDGQNAKITITTTTENVTQKQVRLLLSKNCSEIIMSDNTKRWTDGVIIIPKVATIGEPFLIEPYKDDSYASELPNENALLNYIKGGISTIIATSENNLIAPASTTVYVDVPVLKTEMVVFNNSIKNGTLNSLEMIEYSSLATNASNDEAWVNVNAGDKFYIGVKFYPSASAIKYSRVKSTNMLIEYKTEILNKLESLGLAQLYANIEDLFASSEVDMYTLMNAYSLLINSGEETITEYLENLSESFYTKLKYFNIIQKTSGEQESITVNGRVLGTNIYECTASQNLGQSDFYVYSFKMAGKEDLAFALMEDGEDILQMLEREHQKNDVLKTSGYLNIVDVEVDTIEMSGRIENFLPNSIHTVYAIKEGNNTTNESYLKIKLSNSNIPDINLQNGVKNVGIRFEVKQGVNWVDASEIIKIKNVNLYKTYVFDGKTYYAPYGTSNYWEIYSENYIDGVFRAIVKYFAPTDDIDNPYTVGAEIAENKLPQYLLITKEEKMVSWLDVSLEELNIVNIQGVLNSNGELVDVSTNEEYNLANNVNRQILNQNTYTTIKYFIFCDDTNIKLSEYFETVNVEGIEYAFNDGSIKTLYELSSSTVKLKDITKVPNSTVKAIFVTVKTDIDGRPIMNSVQQNKYEIAKYSAVQDNLLERLSYKEFKFVSSINSLTAQMSVLDANNAGVVDEKLLVAQNAQNILSVEIYCDDVVLFEEVINNNNITVVAKQSTSTTENYIQLGNGILTSGKITYPINTVSIANDVEVQLYVVYTVSGSSYLFPVTYTYYDDNVGNDITLKSLTIVKNINSSASFVIYSNINTKEELDLTNIDYIEVTTEFTTEIAYVYTIYFKDATKLKINSNQLFDNDGSLYVKVKNFLNKAGNDKWELSTNNAPVAKIDNETGKKVDFIANGEVQISVLLEGITEIQDTLKFKIANDGYVCNYVTNDKYGRQVYTFDKNSSYESKTIILSVDGVNGTQITLEGAETEIDASTSLFAMWYKLGEDSDNIKKLSFKVLLADDQSKDVYRAITGNEPDDELSSFSLNKTLGETVVLHLIYVNEDLNINQKITLNILWAKNVSSFAIKDGETELTPVANAEYIVSAGYGYTFETVLSKCDAFAVPNYYILTEDGKKVNIKSTQQSIVKYEDEKYIFTDVGSQKTFQIYISDISGDLEIGDLQHSIKINVKPNIQIQSNIVNAGYRYSDYLDVNGRLDIPYSTFFERIVGDYPFDNLKFKITNASAGISPLGDNSGIQISQTSVVNSSIIRVAISYSDYSMVEISITVFVNDFEKAEATRIAKYNSQKTIILVVGDLVDEYNRPTILTEQLEGNVSVIGSFDEYVADGEIAVMSNSLFTDTNCFAVVSDNAGNESRYKLIISHLQYPFVNFKFNTEEKSIKDLDVYKLFVSLDKNGLEEYYAQNGAYAGDIYYGVNNIELLSQEGTANVFTFTDNGNIVLDMPQIGNEDVAEFAYISGTKLITNEIGREYVSILVVLRYNKSANLSFNIPVVIKAYQSQKLNVRYPFSSEFAENKDGYGTDEYDNANMFAQTTPFGNAIMEYADFKISGTTSVLLESNRFEVIVKEGDNWIIDEDYNGGFKYSLSKVYINIDGAWSELSNTNMSNYVEISENTVLFNQNGVRAIRAKILVETTTGAASNYYYIQAGETEDFKLYKKEGGIETQINHQDTIDVVFEKVIAIGEDLNADYNYYTKEYSEHLQFEIIGDESLYEIIDGNKIKIRISPNAKSFIIKVYTIYGEIVDINVKIGAYYTAVLKDIQLFGGTKIKIDNIISVKRGNDVVDSARLNNLSFGDIMVEDYSIVDDYILFKASETQYTISHFECYINVDDLVFHVVIDDEIIIYPPISILNDVLDLGTQTESSGQITIYKDVWEQAFGFDYKQNGIAIPVDNISFRIICNNQTLNLSLTDIKSDIVFDFGVITKQTTANFIFQVVFGDITMSAKAKMIVNPEYVLILNYPNSKTKLFDREYIQIGSTVDFGGNNFYGNPRISFKRVDASGKEQIITNYTLSLKGTKLDADIEFKGKSCKFSDVSKGTYEVAIAFEGREYGRYVIELIESSPLTVDTSNIEGQVFYAGLGADDVFNYVDIVVDMPTAISGLSHSSTFGFYALLNDEEYKELKSGIFFNGADMNRTYSFAVDLEKYSLGVNTNNVYVGYKQDGKMQYVICRNVSIFERVAIMYQGTEIDSSVLQNVVDVKKTAILDENNIPTNGYRFALTLKADSVCKESVGEQVGEYSVACDIQLTKDVIDGVNVVLNANEYPDGLSFIDLFDVRDLNNKKFWYNNVGENASLTLRYSASEKSDNMRSLLITDRVFNGRTYDYYLKALGAKNNGTTVVLEIVYEVEGVRFTDTVKIKIISDMVVNLLNNDNSVTENSETNPLVLSAAGQNLILADATQSDNRNNQYYIWAYSKYDSEQNNVAQTIKPNMSGDESLTEQNLVLDDSSSDKLLFNYKSQPEFGDKYITLTFVDNYGYTFTYYITLIAKARIEGVTLNKDVYFEGEAINIYNVNDESVSGGNKSGIALDVRTDSGAKDNSQIFVQNIKIISISGEEFSEDATIIFTAIADTAPTLKHVEQSFWQNYGNGLSASIKIEVTIGKSQTGGETYTFARTFVFCKRYELSVKQENTYVRDGQEFDIEHIVSVYDYQRGTYLAEPKVSTIDAMQIYFEINENYTINVVNDTILSYTITNNSSNSSSSSTSKFALKKGTSGTKISLFDLMDARKNDSYPASLGTIYKVQNDGTISSQEETWSSNIADAVLNALGIRYVKVENNNIFTMSFLLKAIDKKDSNKIVIDRLSDIKLEFINNKYVAKSFIYFGGDQAIFHGASVNKEEYNFELISLDNIVYGTNESPYVAKLENGIYSSAKAPTGEGAGIVPIVVGGEDEDMLAFTTISILDIAVNDQCTIYFKVDGTVDSAGYSINGTKFIYYLDDEKYVGKKIEIYTGKIGSKKIFNGFDIEGVKTAKNIHSVRMVEKSSGAEINQLDLTEYAEFSIDANNIYFQTRDIDIEVQFKSNSNKYMYNEPVRITTYYTGVNTRAGAYIGNAIAKYIKFDESDIRIKNKLDDYGALIGEVTISFEDWSDGFKLIPGIGYFGTLAGDEDLTFNKGIQNGIMFEFAGIVGEGATSMPYVNMDNNTLKLLPGFILLDKFIAINVLCSYPHSSGGNANVSPLIIGTIYLGFTINNS